LAVDFFRRGEMGSHSYFLLAGSPAFVLVFDPVEAICAYEETTYWSLAEEQARPRHVLNLISDTPLLLRLRDFRHAPWLWHFVVCGGDMCAEVVAGRFAILDFATTGEAENALSHVMTGQFPSALKMNWVEPEDAAG
jgi:hypothetical protein